MSKSILVVDDEATQLRLIGAVTEREGYKTRYARSGQEAIDILTTVNASDIDLVILDLSMPKISGIDVLNRVKTKHPALPVIVLTAHSSISNVVECMRAGATDFLVKPASAERIRTAIQNALENSGLIGELRPLTEKIDATLQFSELVGHSPSMAEAVMIAKKAAASNIPVLIEGESGVGKELFAKAIQSASPRSRGAFVTVNCGAIPANLVESLLFGHEKGAFTGATERHIGKFVEADRGTIFLDEIGELPLDTQVKLLRVLQEGEVDPIGARDSTKVDVRIVSATNRDLLHQVEKGEFREDLYYRLNVFPVRIPPLRKRRDDIPSLVKHFIHRISLAENVAAKDVDPSAMTLLQDYNWPGNVRQLQNAIFRAVVLSDHEILTIHDFPQVQLQASGQWSRQESDHDPYGHGGEDRYIRPSSPGRPGASLALLDEQGQIRKLAELESEIIRLALQRYKGRMSEVARRLGIGRSTLYRKVAELGLDENDHDDDDENVVISSQSSAIARSLKGLSGGH